MKKLPGFIKKLLPERKDGPEKPVCQENPQTITLHFVDELTGRTATFDFPRDSQCRDVVNRLHWEAFLPKDVYAFQIREFACFPSYQEINGIHLRNGDTLHVVLENADELRKSGSLSRFLADRMEKGK